MAHLKQQHTSQVLRVSGREGGRGEERTEGRMYKVRKDRKGGVRNGWRQRGREEKKP